MHGNLNASGIHVDVRCYILGDSHSCLVVAAPSPAQQVLKGLDMLRASPEPALRCINITSEKAPSFRKQVE
jgi:hypothetical protein